MQSADAVATTVSTKGQVILPKAIRDQLNWTPGTRLTVERTEGGVLLKQAPVFPPTRPEDVFAMLQYDGPPRTIAEMHEAVLEEARRRYARD